MMYATFSEQGPTFCRSCPLLIEPCVSTFPPTLHMLLKTSMYISMYIYIYIYRCIYIYHPTSLFNCCFYPQFGWLWSWNPSISFSSPVFAFDRKNKGVNNIWIPNRNCEAWLKRNKRQHRMSEGPGRRIAPPPPPEGETFKKRLWLKSGVSKVDSIQYSVKPPRFHLIHSTLGSW